MSSLSPTIVAELSAVQQLNYFYGAACVMYVYDWLLSIKEEVEIVTRSGLSWSIAVYFLSRITDVLLATIQLAPVPGSCERIFLVEAIFTLISIASTSYLFLQRVRAVYLHSRLITIIFGGGWLATIGIIIFTTVKTRAERLASDSQKCNLNTTQYLSWTPISSFTFDTLVFLAISYRLAANAATERTWRSSILSLINGQDLYRLSRSLLRSGQLYYVTIIMYFFVNLIMLQSPLVPQTLRWALVSPYTLFTNTMACRIFRAIALGMIDDRPPTGLDSAKIASAFRSQPPPAAYNATQLR